MSKNKLLVVAAAVVVAIMTGIIAGVVSTDSGEETTVQESSTAQESSTSDYSEALTVTQPAFTETESESESEQESTAETTTEKKFDWFGKDDEEETSETTTEATSAAIEDYEFAYAGFNPAYADPDARVWNLLLVNRDYILPEDFEDTLELAPSVESDPSSCKLDYRAAPHYNRMYLAAKEDGITLTPVSGYRSRERQEGNFRNKIQSYMDMGYSEIEATQMAATRILPPGTSEHNAGLAMDICVASTSANFEQTDEFAWLMENAADYGFILRYPEDKQDITKITYEPWHWRYVGVENAKAMKASGECLEEYLGYA